MADTATRTLEIKADTSQANRELARANAALREIVAEMGALKAEGKLTAASQATLNKALADATTRLDAAQGAAQKAATGLEAVRASGKVSAVQVDKLQAALDRTASQARIAGAQARKTGQDIGAMGGRAREAEASVTSSIKAFDALRGALIVTTAVKVGEWLVDGSREAIKTSAAAQALQFSIDGARESTMGLTDDLTLMQAANKAAQFGVANSAKEFADLAGAATKVAMTMGTDAKDAIQGIAEALGKGSVERLDEYGIVLKLEEAQQRYADQLGVTVDALTDEQKASAVAVIGKQELLRIAGELNVELGQQDLVLAQAATAWENMSGGMQQWAAAAAGYVVIGLQGIGVAVGNLVAEIVGLNESMETSSQTAARMAFIANRDAKEITAMMEAEGIAAGELNGEYKNVAEIKQKINDISAERLRLAKQEEDDIVFASFDADEAANKKYLDAKQRERDKAASAAKKAADARRKAAEEEERYINDLIGRVENSLDLEGTASAVNDFLYEQEGRALDIRKASLENDIAWMDARLAAEEAGSDGYFFLLDQKTAKELEVLEIERSITTDTIRLAELETASKKVALDNQLQHMRAAADKEKAIAKQREAVITAASEQVASVLSATAVAAMDAAEGEERAGIKAAAGVLKSMRNTLIATSIKEAALAVASAASYNFPGAAAHAVAAGQAAAGAVAVGALGAIAGAAAGGGGSSGGSGRPSTSDGGGSEPQRPTDPNAGNDALDVPVSQDPNLRGVRSVPQKQEITQIVFQGGTFFVDDEETGRRLLRTINKAKERGAA